MSLRQGYRTLPAEILYEVISYLNPTDRVNLIFSDYDFLCRHGMVPALSRQDVDALICVGGSEPGHAPSPLERLPTEVLLQILTFLPLAALCNMALAYYHHLRSRGIAGRFVGEEKRCEERNRNAS